MMMHSWHTDCVNVFLGAEFAPPLNLQGIRPDFCSWRLVVGELQMSILQSTITETKANLYTQLRELERLRDQVKQAEMLARKSQSGGKRTQDYNEKGASVI
jgi:hypothetical protein